MMLINEHNKAFMDTLSVDYQGQFSPDMKSLALQLYQDDGITELALNRFFFLNTKYLYFCKYNIKNHYARPSVISSKKRYALQ